MDESHGEPTDERDDGHSEQQSMIALNLDPKHGEMADYR